MSNAIFQQVCDHVSKAVDGAQFERFRWDRDEAPKLKRLNELVQEAFAQRDDFDLAEEGATSGFKRYVVKVHSQRTIGISVKFENGQAVLGANSLERSQYAVSSDEPVAAPFEKVDEDWVAGALQTLLSRITRAN